MRKSIFAAFAGFIAVAFIFGPVSYAGSTVVVSVDSAGRVGKNHSNEPAISADGRYVAFRSSADNLAPGDTNDKRDIFVHDQRTGKTKSISKDSAGTLGNNYSSRPAISADGRYVAFESMADNLVPGDTNDKTDIFIHDGRTGKMNIISRDSKGTLGNNDSGWPAISANGRYVAFRSSADNLVPGDANNTRDIFVHDRRTGKTTIISKDGSGILGNNESFSSSISADGRYVAFRSSADNLAPGDTNGKNDIFVHDRRTGETTIMSKDSAGKSANGSSDMPFISADGRYVAFESDADNLVPGDTNGKEDAFVHDRRTGKTIVVSVDSDGVQGNGGGCFSPVISNDGRYVAFETDSSNLAPNDKNGMTDIFVHDLR